MKTNCILALMLIFGAPASMLAVSTSLGLTTADCALIFPGANSCEKARESESGILKDYAQFTARR